MGPRIPIDTSTFLNAKTCPKLRTSNHFSQASRAHVSRFAPFFFCISSFRGAYESARSFRLWIPSSARSSDCTKIFCPISCQRFLIFRLIHTSEISPYPSKFSRGRFPFKGSPLGLALFADTSTTKSIFPFSSLIPISPLLSSSASHMTGYESLTDTNRSAAHRPHNLSA